jgi:hypothetical protein
MDPRLCRPDGDAERVGNLWDGQAKVEVKDNGGSLTGLQPAKAAGELVVVVDGSDVVARHGLEPDHPDLNGLAHLPPSLVCAGVDDEPMEPRVPALGIAQFREALPGTDDRVLDGVFGHVSVTEDEHREAVQPVAHCRREDFEGLVVTVARRFDEIALQHSLPSMYGPGRPARHYMTLPRG